MASSSLSVPFADSVAPELENSVHPEIECRVEAEHTCYCHYGCPKETTQWKIKAKGDPSLGGKKRHSMRNAHHSRCPRNPKNAEKVAASLEAEFAERNRNLEERV